MNIVTNKKRFFFFTTISCVIYILQNICLHRQINHIFSEDILCTTTIKTTILLSYSFGLIFYLLLALSLELYLEKNKAFLSYMKEMLICFLPLFVLLICMWPGIFKGDEFYVLRAIRGYEFSPAQTGLTSLFYIFCLRFFPSLGSISFFHILLISGIYGSIFYGLKKHYTGKQLIPCRLILLLFPIIDGAFFTLRASLVGWLFLWVMIQCFLLYKEKETKNAFLSTRILIISCVAGLIIAWRSEFIYLLLMLPLYFFCITRETSMSSKKSIDSTKSIDSEKSMDSNKSIVYKKSVLLALISMIAIFACYSVCNVPNKIALKGSNKYPISLVINPLGNIFAQDVIKGDHAYDDVMTINETIDVAQLRIHHSYKNISQYWNIPDILPENQLHDFMVASIDLIIHNPDVFLQSRWKTFCYTNGMVADEINHPTAPTCDTIYSLVYYDEDYTNAYYVSSPFVPALRNELITLFSCRLYDPDNTKTNVLYPILYNCLPVFVFAFVWMLYCFFKKKFSMGYILLMTGAQTALIFLTAPAMFFMYYFCFYLAGYFLFTLFVTDFVICKK